MNACSGRATCRKTTALPGFATRRSSSPAGHRARSGLAARNESDTKCRQGPLRDQLLLDRAKRFVQAPAIEVGAADRRADLEVGPKRVDDLLDSMELGTH